MFKKTSSGKIDDINEEYKKFSKYSDYLKWCDGSCVNNIGYKEYRIHQLKTNIGEKKLYDFLEKVHNGEDDKSSAKEVGLNENEVICVYSLWEVPESGDVRDSIFYGKDYKKYQ